MTLKDRIIIEYLADEILDHLQDENNSKEGWARELEKLDCESIKVGDETMQDYADHFQFDFNLSNAIRKIYDIKIILDKYTYEKK